MPSSHKEEGTEKHRLYHCPETNEVRREIPEIFRKWKQKNENLKEGMEVTKACCDAPFTLLRRKTKDEWTDTRQRVGPTIDAETDSDSRRRQGPRQGSKKLEDQRTEKKDHRKERRGLWNEFDTGGFMAQKGLWNVAREKMMQDRGCIA